MKDIGYEGYRPETSCSFPLLGTGIFLVLLYIVSMPVRFSTSLSPEVLFMGMKARMPAIRGGLALFLWGGVMALIGPVGRGQALNG